MANRIGDVVFTKTEVFPPGKPPIQEGNELTVLDNYKGYLDLAWSDGRVAIRNLHQKYVTKSENVGRRGQVKNYWDKLGGEG